MVGQRMHVAVHHVFRRKAPHLRSSPVDEHANARQVNVKHPFARGLQQQAEPVPPQRGGVFGEFQHVVGHLHVASNGRAHSRRFNERKPITTSPEPHFAHHAGDLATPVKPPWRSSRGAQKVHGLLRNHHRGGIGIAAHDARHDRCVHNAHARQAMHP